MAALSANNPTLLDLVRRTDPDGMKLATIIEMLTETNDILEDMTWLEGNLTTGHRSTIRTGLPAPTWRKLYGGVQPTKSTTAQVTDNTGMLEAYAEIDKALADLNGNSAQFRAQEDRSFLEGMNQEMANTIFYGDEGVNPERFTGLSSRFNDLAAENADSIVPGGGVSTDNSSIWLVVWGPTTCHGIIPKGSNAGFQMNDKGQVTIEDADGSGGRMEAYRTHYRWDAGLTVRDWRYVVRIPNIDKSLLIPDASTGADIVDLMVQAIEKIPTLSMGRPVFYVPLAIRTMLRRQITSKVGNSTLSMENVAGKMVVSMDGIPVKRCDALTADEALVT